MRGLVKWYSEQKGYGFIISPEANTEVFFHISSLKPAAGNGSLHIGDEVDFQIEHSPLGPKASQIRKI